MGPMVAAGRFLDQMRASPFQFAGLRASLHGSLAFTGVGHATDRATILGLAGFTPEDYDAEAAEKTLDQIWVLVRAIKVQSQVLQLYVGHPVLDV